METPTLIIIIIIFTMETHTSFSAYYEPGTELSCSFNPLM